MHERHAQHGKHSHQSDDGKRDHEYFDERKLRVHFDLLLTNLRPHAAAQKIARIDRAGLQALTCECYGVVRKEFDRLLPGVTES